MTVLNGMCLLESVCVGGVILSLFFFHPSQTVSELTGETRRRPSIKGFQRTRRQLLNEPCTCNSFASPCLFCTVMMLGSTSAGNSMKEITAVITAMAFWVYCMIACTCLAVPTDNYFTEELKTCSSVSCFGDTYI